MVEVKKYFKVAVIVFTIANLFLANFVFAKQLEIKASDVERIKMVLDISKIMTTVTDLILKDKDFLTILNTVIGAGKTATDITYGLVVLSALGEMDLIDLVVSQQYKIDARNYFNQVLDERTNLRSYWKGVSTDIPRVLSGYITGPMAALTLNSFEITDKAIAIFVEFNVLEKMKLYDGLWYYFDTRKQGGEPHKVAWDEAKEVMGFATKDTSFLGTGKNRDDKDSQLEQQFLTLYNNWAPYVTPYGISEEYKKQVKEELSLTLIAAAKDNAVLVQNESKPSLIDKLAQQLDKLKEATAALMAKVNPFKAGIALNLPEEPVQEMLEAKPPTFEEQEVVEEIIMSTTTAPEVPEIEATTTKSVPEPEPEPAPIPEPELPLAPKLKPVPPPGPVFCERKSGNPTRFRVLISEIAWMGTTNSSNDEWIELKNVWGIPVNLNGWQLLDKDRQIKIIFGEKDIIPANGYYLLERTDDNSIPEIKANLIYTGALSNTDEALYLFDDQCNIEDEVLADPNWPAGDNSLKKPMERLDVLYWYTGVSTPGSENSSPPIIYSSTSAPAPSSAPSSPHILITETYIGSEGNQKDDFVELYNPNLEAINLTDYYIQRKTESAQDFSTYISHELLAGKTIEAQDYFLIANASSTFATSADVVTDNPLTENNTLVLKNPKQEIIDQVSTDNPDVGKSYGRKWSSTTLNYTEDFEAQISTPRAQNQNSINEEDDTEEIPIVIISEVAWMGTTNSPNDEWIELYNNTSSTIDLTGWTLKAADGTPEIQLAGMIPADGFYLLERTDDNTISDITADQIYTGALGNDGEDLGLYDTDGSLIDFINASSGWPAGNNQTKQTMERINSNWASNNLVTKNGLAADNNPINGTPRAENSVAKSSTDVVGGLNITENFTLTLLGSPYLVEGSIIVGASVKLTIEPGVIIKFKHNVAWKSELRIKGELAAIGTETQKIIFTSSSTTPVAGDWEWLYFENASSTLKNVVIQYAGKEEGNPPFSPPYTRGAIYVDGGSFEISNSKIEESQTLGIWLTNSALATIDGVEFLDADGDWEKTAAVYIENSNSTIKNSTFKNNKFAIWVEDGNSPVIENNIFQDNETPIKTFTLLPSFSNNIAQNNNINGILVVSLGFSDSIGEINWCKTSLPYILESSATVPSGKTLNIEAGTVVKLKGGGRLYVDGTLAAQGTQAEKIIFTSLNQETAGSWHYIGFSASSVGSILDNVIVRYGGWYNVFEGGTGAKSGAVKVDGANLTIKNSLFENNLYAGLELINSTTTLANTAFNKNENGIYVESGDCPDLSSVTFGEGDNANSVNIYPSTCVP